MNRHISYGVIAFNNSKETKFLMVQRRYTFSALRFFSNNNPKFIDEYLNAKKNSNN